MNILIAPNSMKGSLNAFDFAEIVKKAFIQVSDLFEIRKIPVADGGDFTGEVLKRRLNANEILIDVYGPFGELVKSKYAISDKIAIIEMADASGMKLVDEKALNPMKASSYGTGQLIVDAIKKGCVEIFLAIGGSATVDGGMGMLSALGFSFLDKNNMKLAGNGKNLSKIYSIIKPDNFKNISIKIICDVDNLLLGENGAAAVFGPQKGATPKMVIELENGLNNLSKIIYIETGKKVALIKGGGAAGGVAIPLIAFYDAYIVSGADFILSQLNFTKHVKWADIIITGEGKIDAQTFNNKAPYAVAKMARKYNKSVYAIGGQVEGSELSLIFDKVYSLTNKKRNIEYAIKNAEQLLFETSVEMAKIIIKLK